AQPWHEVGLVDGDEHRFSGAAWRECDALEARCAIFRGRRQATSPDGPPRGGIAPSEVISPALEWDGVLRSLRPMPQSDSKQDPRKVPAVLMGGVNLVRCLGLGAIPAIVATPDRAEPALGSRHCHEAVILPPYDRPEAAAAALEQ